VLLHCARIQGLLLFCVSLAAVSASCGGAKEDSRLTTARQALEQGEIQRGYDLVSDLLLEQPQLGEALDLKGLALQAMGRGEAERAFRDAIARIPLQPEPHDHLAGLLYQTGRMEEAIAEWREAVRVAPSYAVGHYNLGSAYQTAGRQDEAAAEFREALRHDPSLARARLNLGIALVSLNRFPEAEKELREAARLAPGDPEAAFNLGAALVSARKTEEGIRELQRALSLRRDFAEAHERIATAHFSDGNLPEAENEFREALRIRPDYPDARLGLGVLFNEQGKVDEAIGEYELALQSQPDHASASTNLALLYGRSPGAPARSANRVAAFEIYRRHLLAKDWRAAWDDLSKRTRALYLDDPQRFRYAAQKGFAASGTAERLSSPGFFLRYLEPPAPDPSSGLPYDPGRMGAVQEGDEGEWKVDFLVLSGLPSPDPER